MSKKTAAKRTTKKAATKTTKKGRRRVAVEVRATTDKSCGCDPTMTKDIVGPIDEGARRQFAANAMEELRAGGRPSRKPQIWALRDGLLYEIAVRAVSGRESVKRITDSIAKEIAAAKITPRIVERFIDNIRAKYLDIVYAHTLRIASDPDVKAVGGDLEASLQLLLSKMYGQVMRAADASPFGASSVGDKHAYLRATEIFVDAAKIMADKRVKEAQANRIADQIIAAQEKRAPGKGSGGKGQAAMTRDEIVSVISRVMLGDAPSGKESAE